MNDLRSLEDKYLKAKIAYYEGTPLMSDAEFDALETHLKNLGSKAPEQVGSKRKDFDFAHPSPMRSLAKIQTEATEEGTYYAEDQFIKWLEKREAIVGKQILSASPKFDGNAINIIYRGNKLSSILTRGDGITGKDITRRMSVHVPDIIKIDGIDIADTDIIEIRAEVVIDVNLFNSKYSEQFANARNYVAGVIGKDDEDIQKVSELTIIPLHFLLNGKQVNKNLFFDNEFVKDWDASFSANLYEGIIKSHEKLRETINYQLDGVVISFPVDVREVLGENDHDPEWAIAIKFVPVETITDVEGIEWNVSKKGEIMPTVLLSPVFLDGSTVRRASGYNAGYITKNGIGVGAKVSLAKAGDIIPEIQKVIAETTETFVLPCQCPACESKLSYDGIHLMCSNENCVGKIAKQLTGALSILGIKGIGEKTIEPFAKDFKNMFDLMVWVLGEGAATQDIEKYGIKMNSRSHELFIQAFKNIKSLTYQQIIQMLGYENVGEKLSVQLAREHADLDFDYSNLEKALVQKMRSTEVSVYIIRVVQVLENLGITIDRPKKSETADKIGVCLTGSPKNFGYKTKEEFLNEFPQLTEVSITDKKCQYLITDSYQSTSSKMNAAVKKQIEIFTYGDFHL